jgi:hypothetical protein
VLPSFEGSWLCYVQAVCVTYFLLASILWTAAISHALWTVTITLNPDFWLMERRYVALAYGLPAISLFLPLVENEYGPAEGWCWISPFGWGANVLRLLCYYLPLCAVLFYNVRQYRRIIAELRENSDEENVSKRLKFYPWALLVTQAALALHRLLYLAAGVSFAPLAILGVLTTTLMGLTNALLYGFNEALADRVRKWFRASSVDPLDEQDSSLVHTSLNR